MRFQDLEFSVEEYDISSNNPSIIRKSSAFREWPSFPEEIFDGELEDIIIAEAIEALREVLGENCLDTEFDGKVLTIHCGDLDSKIQEKWYDFRLVSEG